MQASNLQRYQLKMNSSTQSLRFHNTFASVIFMYETLPKPERKIQRKKFTKTLNFLLFVSRKISPWTIVFHSGKFVFSVMCLVLYVSLVLYMLCLTICVFTKIYSHGKFWLYKSILSFALLLLPFIGDVSSIFLFVFIAMVMPTFVIQIATEDITKISRNFFVTSPRTLSSIAR